VNGETRTPRTRRTLRREDLLRSVADFITEAGLHGFTLRQAAAAAGTTHKVLLYHFGSADALIMEAVDLIRADARGRTVEVVLSTAADLPTRLRALWGEWHEQVNPVLYEVLGLAMAEPDRYGESALRATVEALEAMRTPLAKAVGDEAADAAATLVLGTVRGLVIDRAVTGADERTDAAWELFALAMTTLLARD